MHPKKINIKKIVKNLKRARASLQDCALNREMNPKSKKNKKCPCCKKSKRARVSLQDCALNREMSPKNKSNKNLGKETEGFSPGLRLKLRNEPKKNKN